MTRNGRAYVVEERAAPLAGYPHLRAVNGFLFVSGVSSRQPDGTVAGVGDVRSQTRAVIENLRALLHSAGADLDCLVNVTGYLVDMRDYGGYNEVYNEYFTAESGPARTTVAVHQLPGADLRIEIAAVAAMPRGRRPVAPEAPSVDRAAERRPRS